MTGVRISALLACLGLLLAGCSTFPGVTRQDQVSHAEHLLARTLAEVRQRYPQSTDELAQSAGYVVLENKITKIPVVGAGAGYGVAVDNRTGERTYLRLRRFDFGAGWGVRRVRPVLIFANPEKFREFVDGVFTVKLAAEASAKAGDAGVAGNTGGRFHDESGYTGYLLTEAGMSATWSLGFIRVKRMSLKKDR